MCFAQGVVWTLILSGWRHWNRSAKFSGQSVGAKIRRWWWGVNNWKIPEAKSQLKNTKLAKNVSEVSAAFLEVWHPGAVQPTGRRPHTNYPYSTTRRSSPAPHRIERGYSCITWRTGIRLRNIRHFLLRIPNFGFPSPKALRSCSWRTAVPRGCAFLHFCLALVSSSAVRTTFLYARTQHTIHELNLAHSASYFHLTVALESTTSHLTQYHLRILKN